MHIMKNLKKYLILSLLVILLGLVGCQHPQTEEQKLADFFAKDNVRIIVTDSGLGGLSVAADVFKRLKINKVFKNAEVIFFNAQPHLESGYNMMATTDQKVQVFDNALHAMDKEFKPDAILIACNTLSVLYDYTNYSKDNDIPVISIVGTGVDLIKSEMTEDSSQVIIFATGTTVKQGKHKDALIKDGISADRIWTQACPGLAGQIERGPHSDSTVALVNRFVKNITSEIPESNKNMLVSYNCTHYGYVDGVFKKAFKDAGIHVKKFLDPNPLMSDFMFEKQYLNRYPDGRVNIRVFSQPEIIPEKQTAISDLIKIQSLETAEALLTYTFVPEFFEWRSIAETVPEQ